ncbi:hypothetical protein GGX14DRAFT_445667 [Mycena pura]|uniref:DUF7918 domain-containing protein n=1 Tax=Mycena pura TaxID=153505 RepID=A0AAD6VH49_9AGAR|nr:hypothetical protein GGX14DRAFT_445667 [Mycena pura]
MLLWREFTAWVTIDGQEATEYGIETSEDQKTVTCWIASELGKTFSVHWRNASYPHDTAGYVKMDGSSCGGIVLYRQSVPRTVEKNGVSDGFTVRPFMFSSLELTDDDALLGSSSSYQDLGIIELMIVPVQVTQRGVPGVNRSLAQLKIHERSKKAVTQQISLAESKIIPNPAPLVRARSAGPGLVKFYFKYRPMDVLRANGIVPYAPELKTKTPVDPPRASTSGANGLMDMKGEKFLRDKLNAGGAKVESKDNKPVKKRESGDVIDLTQESSRSKKLKLEGKRPFIKGEIIDLT